MICGLGIDIIEISRIESMLARWGQRFVAKVFTQPEIEFCERRADRAAAYAVRFAAKEAFAKALGTGWDRSFSWMDFSVQNQSNGRPIPTLSPRMQLRFERTMIHLSLSHSEHYATAVVIFETTAVPAL